MPSYLYDGTVPHPSQLPTCGRLRLVIFESPVGLVASPTCGTMPRSSCGVIPHSTCGTMPLSSWHNATSDSWCSAQFNLGHCRLVAQCHTQLVAQSPTFDLACHFQLVVQCPSSILGLPAIIGVAGNAIDLCHRLGAMPLSTCGAMLAQCHLQLVACPRWHSCCLQSRC
jgi:hypothetical protein